MNSTTCDVPFCHSRDSGNLERISFCSGMNKTQRFVFLPRKTQKTRNLLFFRAFRVFRGRKLFQTNLEYALDVKG